MNIAKNPKDPRSALASNVRDSKGVPGTARTNATIPPTAKEMLTADVRRPSDRIRAAKLVLFAEEYLNANFNGTKAAIAMGYSRKSARIKASELLAVPEVIATIEAAMRARAERISLDTDQIVMRMHAIAFADPRELIGVHRYCCRYCYGKDHRYQWTPNELRDVQGARERRKAAAVEKTTMSGKSRPIDFSGGTGFKHCADPNPACPECFGEGVVRVVVHDTRDISPSARLLYAGAKKTPWGVDIKMNNQSVMLTNLAKHLGMFTTNVSPGRHAVTMKLWSTVQVLNLDCGG